jgi:hypothetical protein
MDRREAQLILEQVMSQRKQQAYPQWAQIVGQSPEILDVVGPSGREYCLEIEPIWDAAPGATIRVLFAIHDGGLRAFLPITSDFLIDPDGHDSRSD